MSADSEPPATPEPVPPSPESSAPPAEDTTTPEYLPQKRRHKKPEPAEFDFADAGEEDDDILILGTLLQRLLARKQAASAEPEPRATIKRFAQKSTAPLGAAPTETGLTDAEGSPASANAASGTDSAGPSASPAAAPAPVSSLPKLMPRMSSPTGDDHWATSGRGRGALYFVFCAGLALVAFLVGRGAARPDAGQRANATAATAPAPHWNATLLGKLDQVLAADQGGDLKKAKELALDLKKQIGSSLELDLYLGSLTTRLGHSNDAEADLSRLMEPYMQPLQAAAVNDSLAFTYARRRDFRRAAEAFADASRIDPFEPNNYYRWGEVLRRQGRLQDAIDKFRQTLLRLPETEAESESQRECAAFKMRLSQIELGQDADVKLVIDARLHQPAPGGYWLLTAAAFALQHNDMPGAVDALQKARDTLPAGQYAALVDDYFFHAFAVRPEMVKFLPPVTPGSRQQKVTRMVYFVDP